MKTTGITLLIVGILMTAFTTFRFFTREKVVDLGSVSITREEPHSFNWSPMLGIALIAVGGIILIYNKKSA